VPQKDYDIGNRACASDVQCDVAVQQPGLALSGASMLGLRECQSLRTAGLSLPSFLLFLSGWAGESLCEMYVCEPIVTL
jgi:hypothetical protein